LAATSTRRVARPVRSRGEVRAAKKTASVVRDGRGASEIVSLSDRTAKPCAKRARQASSRLPRWRSRKNSPRPKRTIPKRRRLPAIRSLLEKRLPRRRRPRPMKSASSRGRLLRLKSPRSKSRRPLALLRLQRPTPPLSQPQPPLPRRTNLRGRAEAAGGSGRARALSGNSPVHGASESRR